MRVPPLLWLRSKRLLGPTVAFAACMLTLFGRHRLDALIYRAVDPGPLAPDLSSDHCREPVRWIASDGRSWRVDHGAASLGLVQRVYMDGGRQLNGDRSRSRSVDPSVEDCNGQALGDLVGCLLHGLVKVLGRNTQVFGDLSVSLQSGLVDRVLDRVGADND